jgi:hypothetical protein
MRERDSLWPMVLTAIAVFAASSLVSAAFYEYLIVPRLPSVPSVPIWWWAVAGLPVIIAGLVFGWLVRSVASLLLWSIAGAVGINGYVAWASLMGQHAFVNQPLATESPLAFWALGLAAVTPVLGLLLATGRLARIFLAVLGRPANKPLQPPAFGGG